MNSFKIIALAASLSIPVFSQAQIISQKKELLNLPEETKESSQYTLTKSEEIFSTNPKNIFSFHEPTYFVFGKDDLKLQFSAKFRVAQNYNLYLAYTQLMFWHIYDDSMPFEEINYNPEFFYRIKEDQFRVIRSLDLGFLHTSNGEDGDVSRSINRAYARANAAFDLGRMNLLSELTVHYIFNRDTQSKYIIDHLGYWEYSGALTHLFTHNKAHLDLTFRFFAGKKLLDFDKGAREIGLVYNFESQNFNPNIYFQYYSGYGENLRYQEIRQEQYRLGIMLPL